AAADAGTGATHLTRVARLTLAQRIDTEAAVAHETVVAAEFTAAACVHTRAAVAHEARLTNIAVIDLAVAVVVDVVARLFRRVDDLAALRGTASRRTIGATRSAGALFIRQRARFPTTG